MLPKFNFSQNDINTRVASVNRYSDAVNHVAQQQGIDPGVIKAIIAVESSGNPNAGEGRDTKYAKGLMQIIGNTWSGTINLFPNLTYAGRPLSSYLDREAERAWADPELNILMGTLVLMLKARSLTKNTGVQISVDDVNDAPMFLTAYNSGEFVVINAYKRAVAAGSSNPQLDCLNAEHLRGGIQDTITKYNLNWDIEKKQKEIGEYASKVMTFLDIFNGTHTTTSGTVAHVTPVAKPVYTPPVQQQVVTPPVQEVAVVMPSVESPVVMPSVESPVVTMPTVEEPVIVMTPTIEAPATVEIPTIEAPIIMPTIDGPDEKIV